MPYYHCSPTAGLRTLEPARPSAFEKPAGVYLTTLLPMALMYGIRNFEYTYGYTRDGQIYLEEYFPNALEILYRGRAASLYVCAPAETTSTRIPNEAVSPYPVPVLEEIPVPDVLEALLEQERLGTLVIWRYGELSQKKLEWIRRVEADTIREKKLMEKGGPEADYYRIHYPESWEKVKEEISVQVIEVTEQNIAQAGYIHSESWQESHRAFCAPVFVEKHSPEAQTEYLRREMAAGKRVWMLVDQVPVGIVSVQDSLIENLYIMPGHQRKGYGTKLLHFAMGQCRGRPTLWILDNNEGAFRLYARNGFRKTGRTEKLTETLYELEMELIW